VYHYTSAAGLLGILTSRTLWATEVAGLNDTAEINGGLDFAEMWLGARSSSELAVALLDMVARLRDGHLAGAADVFVLSASLDGDDANQWRVYGDSGRGYSIELDTSAQLSVVASPRSLEVRPDGTPGEYNADADDAVTSGWARVGYSESDRSEVMEGFFAWAERMTREAASPVKMIRLLEGLALIFGIGHGLESAVRLLKGAGFSGEREARIFTMASFGGGRTVGFRPSPFGVVRYLELTHDPRNPTSELIARAHADRPIRDWVVPIKSITCGPRLDLAAGRATLSALLAKAGYGPDTVELRTSAVTLR
jgi:hypothetical protein